MGPGSVLRWVPGGNARVASVAGSGYETGVIVLFLAGSAPSWAADVGIGANLLAMGGVGAAASRDNASIALNPGLLGLQVRYDFQAAFRYGPVGGLQWGLSAMDGKTSKKVAAGIAYTGDRLNPPLTQAELPGWVEPGVEVTNVKRLHDFTGAIGVPLLDRKLSVGVAGNVGLFDNDRQGKGFTLDADAGIGLHPVEALTIGVSARNFLSVTDGDRPPSGRVGVRVAAEDIVAVEANVEKTFLPPDLRADFPLWIGAGIEKPIDHIRLRGGWERDPYAVPGVAGNYATFGLGYEDDAGVIEYGVMIPLDNPTLAGTVHGFQVRFGAPPGIEEPD